jgi:hypothetical protein
MTRVAQSKASEEAFESSNINMTGLNSLVAWIHVPISLSWIVYVKNSLEWADPPS